VNAGRYSEKEKSLKIASASILSQRKNIFEAF